MPFIFFGVAAIILTLVLAVSYICYSMTFKRAKEDLTPREMVLRSKQENIKEESLRMVEALEAIPHEELSIRSHDGYTLRARYYKGEDDAPLDIQCHGYKSHPVRDFSGGAAESIKRGRHVLLIYQRAHGRSEGRSITFGRKESKDLLLWTDFMLKKLGSDTKIIYSGISMGAATVLIAASMNPPKSVKAVIADCPCSSAKEIIKRVIGKMKLPASLCYPFVRLGAIIFGRFDPDKADAARAVEKAKVPILLIHGEDDRFVPPEMSKKIFDNIPGKKQIELFPLARHGTSYLIDKARYMKAVDDFLKDVL